MTTSKDSVTPQPLNPEDIEVEVNYEPDPTDLVLSSVPGGELFDPRKHKFSEDELKPQPMIKKAKKVFVPEEQKVSSQLPTRCFFRPSIIYLQYTHRVLTQNRTCNLPGNSGYNG